MKIETCPGCGHSAPLLYVNAETALCCICDAEYRKDQEEIELEREEEDWYADREAALDLVLDENENDYNGEW